MSKNQEDEADALGFDLMVKAGYNPDAASQVMDKLNQKFGKDTVLLGMTPQQGKAFTGTKIAFTRIHDMEEFLE